MDIKDKTKGSWWYHGQEPVDIRFDRELFLSKSINTAAKYGKHVFCAWVPDVDIVDTNDAVRMTELYGDIEIFDPYSGENYQNIAQFIEENSSDTWEGFENLGLPSVSYIYEGGERNLYLKNPLDVIDPKFIYRMPYKTMYAVVSPDRREDVMENGLGALMDEMDVIFVDDLTGVSDGENDIWEVDTVLVAMVPTKIDDPTQWKLMNKDEAPLRQVITSEFTAPQYRYP